MAQITVNLPGGETATIPDWQVDTNLQNILKQLQSMNRMDSKDMEDLKKVMQNHVNEVKVNATNNKKTSEELKKIRQADAGSRRRLSSTVENIFDTVGSTIGLIAGKSLTVFGSAITIFSGLLVARAQDLGEALNELTKQGVARGDAQGEAVSSQILKLNALGLSTDSAIASIADNSRVFATSAAQANAVIRSFDDLAKSGIDLGMTFGDATAAAADELTQRQNLLNIGRLNQSQQTVLSRQVNQTIRNQIKYSQALGESIDTLSSFADSITTNNGLLGASLLRFNDAVRNDMLNGVRNFAIAMRGMGGEGGGEIAAAVTEAMIGGAIGFSDTAVDMIAVLPSLAGQFNDLIADFKTGQVDGAEAAESFTQSLGNLSQRERDRIFLLARAGDQTARMMAQTVIAFEQSAQRLTEMGFQESDQQAIQKGSNLLQTVFSQLRGTVDFVINSFVFMIGDIDQVGDTIETMIDGFVDFRTNLRNLLYSMMGFKLTNDEIVTEGSALAKFFAGMPEKLQNFADKLNARIAALAQNISDAGGLGAYLKDRGTSLIEVVSNSAKDLFAYLFDEEKGKITQWWTNTGKPMLESTWEKITKFFKELYNKLVGFFGGTEIDVAEVTESPEKKEVVEGSTESSEEVVKEAGKPFLTRMSEKIFQGMINVLAKPESQQIFANVGQSIIAGGLAQMDAYLRALTFEIPAKKDALGYFDFGGIGPVKPFAGTVSPGPLPGGGTQPGPPAPIQPIDFSGFGGVSPADNELKELLLRYFSEKETNSGSTVLADSSSPIPVQEDTLDEILNTFKESGTTHTQLKGIKSALQELASAME